MQLNVDPEALRDWLNEAATSNVVYFRVRRALWEKLRQASVPQTPDTVRIESGELIALRSFLLERNDRINDDKRLAFDTTLVDLTHKVGEGG